MRLFELAHLVLDGPSEGAFHMSEQLALNELLRDGGAVHFHKRLLGAPAHQVQGMRHQLFSRAAFAVDENAAAGGRRQCQLLSQRLHGHAFADDAVLAPKLLTQHPVLRGELQLLDGMLQRQQSLIDGKRLFDKVIRSEFGGANRGFNRAVTGNHDDHRPIFQ